MAEKKNIKAIYEACQGIVAEIEKMFEKDKNAKVDQAILDTLEKSFTDIIDFEKTHLITAHDSFYGCMLMSMDTTINFKQRGAIDIACSKEPFIVSFNPLFCTKYRYSEFTALLVSEILRIAFAHPVTFAEHNHEKDENKHSMLEKASSASVNGMVQNDIRLENSNRGLRLPNDAYTASKLNDDLTVTPKRGESIDYYFKLLEKYGKKDQKQGSGTPGMAGGMPMPMSGAGMPMPGMGMPGQGQPDSNGQPSQDPNGQPMPGQGQADGVATPNNSNGEAIHNWEGQDPDEQKEVIKSMVGNVYNSLSEKQRGLMPAGLLESIKALLAPPEINWKQLLRKLVGTVPVPYRKTRTRLNRRQPYRADLCGKLPKRIVNIVCVFDTSGSMSNRDLAYCMNEVFNIVKNYEGAKITIVECDAQVNRVYQAKNMNQLQTKMSGRGGTSFTPAIEFINGTNKEYMKKWPNLSGKFRDALMVYFTDGYGDYEIPKPRTYRNLWVVLHDVKCLSVKEPYGDVKSLSMDKDWIKMKNEDDY